MPLPAFSILLQLSAAFTTHLLSPPWTRPEKNPPRGLSPRGVSDPLPTVSNNSCQNSREKAIRSIAPGAAKTCPQTWPFYLGKTAIFVKIERFTSAPATAKITPKSSQNFAKITPKLRQKLAGFGRTKQIARDIPKKFPDSAGQFGSKWRMTNKMFHACVLDRNIFHFLRRKRAK